MSNAADIVILLHDLARAVDDAAIAFRLRQLADALSEIELLLRGHP